MIKTLRESKAKLSELVELAHQGQEVLITVRGKVKARLVQAGESNQTPERADWVARLRQAHAQQAVGPSQPSTDAILDADREDRF